MAGFGGRGLGRRIDRRAMLRVGAALGVGAWGGSAAVGAASHRRQGAPAAATLRYQLVASVPEEVFVAQQFIDSTFRRQFPEIEVVVEAAPPARQANLLTEMETGTAPDVFDTWRDDAVAYHERGQILDVAGLAAELPEEEVLDFFSWQWQDFVLPDGARFGMPKYVNLMAVWCNLDKLEAAGLGLPDDGWDHQRYADAARALTRREGGTTTEWGLFYPAFALDRFAYKLEAWGGALVDPVDPTRAAFGDEPALAAAEWTRALTFDDGANARLVDLFPDGGGGVARTIEAFASGRVAMVEDGFYPFAIAAGVGDRFRWSFAPVPTGPARRRVLGTADGFAIWAGTPYAEAAWELVRFLSGPEYQLNLTVLTGYLPNRFSILGDWESICLRAYPNLDAAGLSVAIRAMSAGYPANRPLFPRDAAAQAIIGPALQRVFAEGSAPVASLVDVAAEVTAAQRA